MPMIPTSGVDPTHAHYPAINPSIPRCRRREAREFARPVPASSDALACGRPVAAGLRSMADRTGFPMIPDRGRYPVGGRPEHLREGLRPFLPGGER